MTRAAMDLQCCGEEDKVKIHTEEERNLNMFATWVS